MIVGKKLRKGDTIGFVGPSGAVRTEGAIERAKAEIERMGYKVKLGESCGQVYGYLSGADEVRARDVNAMFMDNEVDAIFCVRGGYGTMRILDLLDYEAIAKHPKIFLGFSDITAMQIAMMNRSDLVTFHGPMPTGSWADGPIDDYSGKWLMRAIACGKPMGVLDNAPDYFPRRTVTPGSAEGMLVGGNLSLIAGLVGTPYELDTKGKILFIEEVGERTYCIDRMLTQLRLAGKFDDCAGVVFGDFKDCPVEYPAFGLTLEQIIDDVVKPCGKPIFSGLQCGHCSKKLTLPLGARCRMDADVRTLEVLEAAVSD